MASEILGDTLYAPSPILNLIQHGGIYCYASVILKACTTPLHWHSRSKPWVSNYPLATLLGKMAQVFAQRSEGCEFESHQGLNFTA